MSYSTLVATSLVLNRSRCKCMTIRSTDIDAGPTFLCGGQKLARFSKAVKPSGSRSPTCFLQTLPATNLASQVAWLIGFTIFVARSELHHRKPCFMRLNGRRSPNEGYVHGGKETRPEASFLSEVWYRLSEHNKSGMFNQGCNSALGLQTSSPIDAACHFVRRAACDSST